MNGRETIVEYAVVDESCNCRRIVRTLDAARALMDKGTIWSDDRTPGPMHIETREVTAWLPL